MVTVMSGRKPAASCSPGVTDRLPVVASAVEPCCGRCGSRCSAAPSAAPLLAALTVPMGAVDLVRFVGDISEGTAGGDRSSPLSLPSRTSPRASCAPASLSCSPTLVVRLRGQQIT